MYVKILSLSLFFHPSVSFFCVFYFFSFQLQKRKEREEQLEDVIQAYEKIHMEKNNLQRDLDKMVRDVISVHCISHGGHMEL